MKRRFERNSALSLVLIAICAVSLSSCRAAEELLTLRQVDFRIDDVANANIAGVSLDRVQSYEDLTITDALRLADGVRRQSIPFRFDLQLSGRNPEENRVQARMVQLDWTLFLQDRETISGIFTDDVVFPPGVDVTVPIPMELDLYQFFRHSAHDLFELALNVAGVGDRPSNIRLEAAVSVHTPIGPIRYPGRVTIVSADIGSAPGQSM